MTFGLLMILDDVIRFLWGPYPLSASVLFENFGSVNIGESIYPTYNFLVIAVGGLAAVFLWAFIYRTRFGVVLRATSQDMRMASALGVNVNRVYVQAFTLGCLMAGLGGAIIVPSQSAVLGMGVDALILSFIVVVVGGLGSLEGALLGALIVGRGPRGGHRVVPGDRAGRALPDRRRGAADPAGRPLRARMSVVTAAPMEHRSPLRSLGWALPALVILVILPWVADQYQTILLAYGLVMGIAALGFNLLLGYTGLLSFGHSAYFGVGAYTVALMVKYLGVTSMELFLAGAIVACVLVTAVFGVACVRYTRIFFGILTHGAVAGAVEPGLQVLLGDGRHRRPARAHADAARPRHRQGRQDRVPGHRVLLLRARRLHHRGGRHVGDRELAVRHARCRPSATTRCGRSSWASRSAGTAGSRSWSPACSPGWPAPCGSRSTA